MNSTKEITAKYDKIRQFPKEIGAVTITAATGPEGVISFKDSTGVTGKFDLATEKGVLIAIYKNYLQPTMAKMNPPEFEITRALEPKDTV